MYPSYSRQRGGIVKGEKLWTLVATIDLPKMCLPFEPNELLCLFLINVRKLDGESYESDYLSTIYTGLSRHLTLNEYEKSILNDDVFKKSRRVLAAKRKQLTKLGLGGKPNSNSAYIRYDIISFLSL